MTQTPPNLDHLENERDVDGRETAVILTYTVVLTAAFFITVFALYTYFHWELDRAMELKVVGQGQEYLDDLRATEAEALAGKKGGIDIDKAIDAVAKDAAAQAQAPAPSDEAPPDADEAPTEGATP